MTADIGKSVLLFRIGERTCALKLTHVLEVMRPLPVDKVANMPEVIRGISIIRGAPTPVVSLARLFEEVGARPSRFVVVRAGERQVALAVCAVLGVFELDPDTLHPLPPLVQDAANDGLEAVGALDGQLLRVLNSANLVPGEVWQNLVPVQP